MYYYYYYYLKQIYNWTQVPDHQYAAKVLILKNGSVLKCATYLFPSICPLQLRIASGLLFITGYKRFLKKRTKKNKKMQLQSSQIMRKRE